MNTRWTFHLALVALFALAVGALFIREPGFGDDFTYWSFAFELHERGLTAWSAQSFHHLRWPVWGFCWLVQCFVGPGLSSYYGEPMLYLAMGAMLTFTFARRLTESLRASWLAAIVFLFHPLLDSVCHRPMPDLSEGIWGGAALLCWWQLQRASTREHCVLWSVGLGACVYIAESNRLTGAFIAPIVGLVTLLYGRRRLGWVLGAGAVAALLYAAECAWYHHLFHDWLHNLHANLGAKGKKGTEAIPLWSLPFRFLGALWKQSALSPPLALLALLGLAPAWRRRPLAEEGVPLGRVVALWAIGLYLEYACAPQSLWPWRPMIRDADRFLAGLTIPFSLLSVLGALWLWERFSLAQRRGGRLLQSFPVVTGAALVVLLALVSARPFYSLGFVPRLRGYLRTLAPGTTVFTHRDMRNIAFLADPDGARKLRFLFRGDIIKATPELEGMAGEASEFWYARKLVWLNTRKQLELKRIPAQAPLPSYFDHPDQEWALARLLVKADTPDLVFYRRRTPAMPPPVLLPAEAPAWDGLFPAFPAEWKPAGPNRTLQRVWKVPPALRGQVLRFEFEAAAPQVQAFMASFHFYHGAAVLSRPHSFRAFVARMLPALYPAHTNLRGAYELKPYLYPQPGKEFFVLPIPPDADECEVQLKGLKEGTTIRFTGFQGSVQPELEKGAAAAEGEDATPGDSEE